MILWGTKEGGCQSEPVGHDADSVLRFGHGRQDAGSHFVRILLGWVG